MAKIRGVKPEFWTDERIVEVSRDARLLFIGMWSFACDNGHLDDKPKQLKMKIFPGDSDTDLDAWLDELVTAGRIIRDGTTITIPKFAEHQKPHKRWWKTCDLPLCMVPDGTPQPVTTSGPTGGNGKPTADCEVDCDGEGDCEGDIPVAAQPEEPSKRRKPSTAIPDNWQPSDAHQKYASEHHLDISSEAFRFRNHAVANDRRVVRWDAAFSNWLAKAEPPRHLAANRGSQPEGW